MSYLYEDEDNGPMNGNAFDRIDDKISTPAIYMDESLPFDDPTPDDGCWNCALYTGDACSKEWNNGDESEYIPDRDDRGWDECCED